MAQAGKTLQCISVEDIADAGICRLQLLAGCLHLDHFVGASNFEPEILGDIDADADGQIRSASPESVFLDFEAVVAGLHRGKAVVPSLIRNRPLSGVRAGVSQFDSSALNDGTAGIRNVSGQGRRGRTLREKRACGESEGQQNGEYLMGKTHRTASWKETLLARVSARELRSQNECLQKQLSGELGLSQGITAKNSEYCPKTP